ncbi:hypothetical protein ODI_R1115 [Orrella dioscoreae]|uniref:Uncharacterized protein n=1 Tax=Orrella dioscoreae TaxID=1851544 RepID=A0A1C3JYY4_9BURK|nr:hypothetical protein ODI_02554 [Orrella dioscoreae]SOE47908.1 hypothetical protein ODI_R1115 [Orrella dioscoreae]
MKKAENFVFGFFSSSDILLATSPPLPALRDQALPYRH